MFRPAKYKTQAKKYIDYHNGAVHLAVSLLQQQETGTVTYAVTLYSHLYLIKYKSWTSCGWVHLKAYSGRC